MFGIFLVYFLNLKIEQTETCPSLKIQIAQWFGLFNDWGETFCLLLVARYWSFISFNSIFCYVKSNKSNKDLIR